MFDRVKVDGIVYINNFKDSGTFSATSDVIKSLFRKYKHFLLRGTLKEMGQPIIIICLFTTNLTITLPTTSN
jgi:hypothetical protein